MKEAIEWNAAGRSWKRPGTMDAKERYCENFHGTIWRLGQNLSKPLAILEKEDVAFQATLTNGLSVIVIYSRI